MHLYIFIITKMKAKIMNEVKVYPKEFDDGISSLVKANNSIAYISPVVHKLRNELVENFVNRAIPTLSAVASRNIDRIDLYPLQTVLVTAGVWNINTDIFTKEETWSARHSAEDKPFNYQHQQDD